MCFPYGPPVRHMRIPYARRYMAVRQKIEDSGTDHRWEFDRKRLFEKTQHISETCGDLLFVVQVVQDFKNLLVGSQLKSITNDPTQLDEINALVDDLTEPFDKLSFNLYDRKQGKKWKQLLASFKETVVLIERKTKDFIDQAFDSLRSAEGAFDLLEKLQTVQSRDVIKENIMEKFDNILRQASKELQATRDLFEANKASPPVYKNYPPVAGAIAWARALYHRHKKPVLRFRNMAALMKRARGEEFQAACVRGPGFAFAYWRACWQLHTRMGRAGTSRSPSPCTRTSRASTSRGASACPRSQRRS